MTAGSGHFRKPGLLPLPPRLLFFFVFSLRDLPGCRQRLPGRPPRVVQSNARRSGKPDKHRLRRAKHLTHSQREKASRSGAVLRPVPAVLEETKHKTHRHTSGSYPSCPALSLTTRARASEGGFRTSTKCAQLTARGRYETLDDARRGLLRFAGRLRAPQR